MTSEDQDILAKISQLAGQINRHKNQSSGPQTQPVPASSASTRGEFSHASSEWRSSRGGYPSRGYMRAGRPQVHRHRTLVLNGAPAPDVANSKTGTGENTTAHTTGSQSWVTKTDRHLQLINTSIFEKESQSRAKAMEESRKAKLKQRDEREKSRFTKHLQHLGSHASHGRAMSRPTATVGQYEITVSGIQFRVAKNGSKLLKLPGDVNAAKATPKTALVGGVKFYRSKNGNMFRAGIVKAHRRSGAVTKIDEPCRAFSTTGTCSKGPRCRYIHDPSKVAVCKEFLMKGSCPSGDSCDLSHDLTPERSPACLHFARGNCSNPSCPYTHVRVSPAAPVCRAFGVYGYCEKGLNCEERHVHECPDFSNTGICKTKGCKLPHRLKASVMRTQTASAEDGNSDLSSDDEDEEIDSDDIDSDDLDEEFFGEETGPADVDIPTQQDFVHFS